MGLWKTNDEVKTERIEPVRAAQPVTTAQKPKIDISLTSDFIRALAAFSEKAAKTGWKTDYTFPADSYDAKLTGPYMAFDCKDMAFDAAAAADGKKLAEKVKAATESYDPNKYVLNNERALIDEGKLIDDKIFGKFRDEANSTRDAIDKFIDVLAPLNDVGKAVQKAMEEASAAEEKAPANKPEPSKAGKH